MAKAPTLNDITHKHDANALLPSLDNTRERDCCPEKLPCDTLYSGDENIQEALSKGVEVIALAKGLSPSNEIRLNDFTIDPNTGFILCFPEGHEPEKVATTRTERKIAIFSKNRASHFHFILHALYIQKSRVSRPKPPYRASVRAS